MNIYHKTSFHDLCGIHMYLLIVYIAHDNSQLTLCYQEVM